MKGGKRKLEDQLNVLHREVVGHLKKDTTMMITATIEIFEIDCGRFYVMSAVHLIDPEEDDSHSKNRLTEFRKNGLN